MANFLTKLFEKLPEWPIKNSIRYFLAFNPLVPKFIQDLSPIKGYELHHKLQPGEVVIDAGAFPGDYTIFAARRIVDTSDSKKSGVVIAFEPNADNRKVLEHNLKAFKLTNVIIVPKGLSDVNQDIVMLKDGLHSKNIKKKDEKIIDEEDGSQTLESNFEIGTTKVCRLDDELKQLGIKKVDFLKMDIEGEEVKALQGAVETLKNNNMNVAIATYHTFEPMEKIREMTGPFKDILPQFNTTIPVQMILAKCGYQTKVDFMKHTTTYGWKDQQEQKEKRLKELKDKYYPERIDH